MANDTKPREGWGSRLGVILAVTGSAVGLGNFLRFPGKAAQYEGGAFMIPYFIALLLLGLPIAWAEWSMGRYGGSKGYNSIPGIFRAVWKNPIAPYMGTLGLLIPVIIYMYYVYIEAWCLAYAVKFAFGVMDMQGNKGAYGEFFQQFVGMNATGEVFSFTGGFVNSSLFFLIICFALNFYLIYRGLNRGIEWFCRLAMPALVVCALIVLVRVLTLGTPDPAYPERNLLNGLGYMWNPGGMDGKSIWVSLGNAQMWLEAAGQIFFSLSVGFGIISCYASYLKPDDDIALSSVTAAAGTEFCEVSLGGLITIPAAFIFLGAAGVVGGTFSLGFMTLPMVFSEMPLGRWVGAVFFFLLFLAAVTSSLSMLQPAIALIEEGLGLGRKTSVTLLGFVTAIGTGFVVYFSKNAIALDTLDFWVGSLCIFILATIQVIMFGWVMGIEKGHEELQRGGAIRIPRGVMFIIKYVAPIYLLSIFGLWIYQQVTTDEDNKFTVLRNNTDAQISMGLIVLVALFFLMLIHQSVRRWNRLDRQNSEVQP